MLSEAARRQVETFEACRQQRNAEALRTADRVNRSIMSARTNGLRAMLAPGWRVWSLEQGVDARMDAYGEGRGGIIVEVTGQRTVTADGEVRDDRAFRCVDPYTGAQVVLTERQVDVDRIQPFDRRETWLAMSKLAEQLIIRKGTRTKSLLEGEHDRLRAIADITRLAAACTVGGVR